MRLLQFLHTVILCVVLLAPGLVGASEVPVWTGLRFGRLIAPAVTEAASLRVGGDGAVGRVGDRAAFAGRFAAGLAVPVPGGLTIEAMVTALRGARRADTFGAVGDGRVGLTRAFGPVTTSAGMDLYLADGFEGFGATSPWAGAVWFHGDWRLAGTVRYDRSDALPSPPSSAAAWAEGLAPGWRLGVAGGRRVGPLAAAASWGVDLPVGPADPADRAALDVAWLRDFKVGRVALGAWFETPAALAPSGRAWTIGVRLGLDLSLRPLARELFPPASEPEPAFSPF